MCASPGTRNSWRGTKQNKKNKHDEFLYAKIKLKIYQIVLFFALYRPGARGSACAVPSAAPRSLLGSMLLGWMLLHSCADSVHGERAMHGVPMADELR